MYIYAIYKQYFNEYSGNLEKIDIVEYTDEELEAISCTKLYNLQVPHDLKHIIKYNHVHALLQ